MGFIIYGNEDSPVVPLMLYMPAKIGYLFFLNFSCVHGLSQWQQAGTMLWLWSMGFSPQWVILLRSKGSRACRLQQLWHTGPVVLAHRLQSSGSIVGLLRLTCSAA